MPDNGAGPKGQEFWLTGWRGNAVSAVIGMAIAVGQAPFSAFWISFPAICIALFFGFSAISDRHASWRGLFVGIGFGAVTFIWIVEPFLVDIGRHGWMAPFALLFMSGGIGLFWALAFWAARKIAPTGSVGLAVALPVCWTAVEMLRAYVFTGFPWGLTAYIWIETPVYQLAALVGPHGLTLMTLLLASSLIFALSARRYIHVGLGLCVGAVVWSGSVLLANQPADNTGGEKTIVRLVQPNANQHQKWDPEFMPMFFDRQLELTAQVEKTAPDLVIWPEVAVPFLLGDPSAPLHEMSAAAPGVPVIFGAQRLEGGRAFNSLAVLGETGTIDQIYDKHHLVPFGEYLPVGALLNRMGLRALAAKYGQGYSAGPGVRTLNLGALGTVLPLICYEAIFPHELRGAPERPNWMLMVTNDAWFGEAAGPLQHLAQARARAVELGLPMVRAANTGVSAVIDARGQIVGSIPLGVSGRLDVALPAAGAPTIYWRFGDSPAIGAMIVLVLFSLVMKHRISIDRGHRRG